MASSVIQKSYSRLKFLCKKRDFLNYHTKRLLARSLVQCQFDYVFPVWFYSLTQDLKNKLQVTQNRLIKFVLDLDLRSHISRDHFIKLNWFPVPSRMDQILFSHVFMILCDKAPCYMKENFNPASNIHKQKPFFTIYLRRSSFKDHNRNKSFHKLFSVLSLTYNAHWYGSITSYMFLLIVYVFIFILPCKLYILY